MYFLVEPPLFVKVTRGCWLTHRAAGTEVRRPGLHDPQHMEDLVGNHRSIHKESVRAAYELEPKELPEEFLSSGGAYEVPAVSELAGHDIAIAMGHLVICCAAPPDMDTGIGLAAKVFSAELTLC